MQATEEDSDDDELTTISKNLAANLAATNALQAQILALRKKKNDKKLSEKKSDNTKKSRK
jgi:hypothetical protein